MPTRRTFTVDLQRQADGSWIAVSDELPGATGAGQTTDEALAALHALMRERLTTGGTEITPAPRDSHAV